MADTGRKVEVRLGAFACKIEGYDDPVERIREIVGLLQRAIAETPALADHFDEAQIEQIEQVLGTSAGDDGGTPSSIVVIRTPEDAGATSEAPPDAAAPPTGETPSAGAAAPGRSRTGEPPLPETGPAAISAAPAAAIAEAAFSAGIAEIGAGREDRATAPRESGSAAGAQAASEPDEPTVTPGIQQSAGAETSESAADEPAQPEMHAAGMDEHRPTPTEVARESRISAGASGNGSQPPSSAAERRAEPARAGTAGGAPAAPVFNIFAPPDTPQPAPSLTSPAAGFGPAGAEAINIFAPPSAEPRLTAMAGGGAGSAPLADETTPPDNAPEPWPEMQDRTVGPEAAEPDAVGKAGSGEPPTGFFERDDAVPAGEVGAAGTNSIPDFGEDRPASGTAGVAAQDRPAEPEEAAWPTEGQSGADEDTAEAGWKAVGEAGPAGPVPEASLALAGIGEGQAEPDVAAAPEPALSAPDQTTIAPAAGPLPASAGADKPAPETAEPVTTAPSEGRAAATAGAARASQTPHASEAHAPDASGTTDEAQTSGLWDPATPPAEAPAHFPEAEPDQVEQAPAVAGSGSDPASGSAGPGPNRFAAMIARLQGKSPAPGPEAATPSRPAAGAAGGGTSAATPAPTAAELAARAGARGVPDLLAVSAAWLTIVERRPRFTRRDVMEVFEELPGDHPQTLEARIKGFGQLVRANTLVLVDDGVFAMTQSERDRFRALLDRG